jgi:hypothetical protein
LHLDVFDQPGKNCFFKKLLMVLLKAAGWQLPALPKKFIEQNRQ